MDEAMSSPSSSFKSKKQLRSRAPSDKETRKASDPATNPWTLKTPGKPVEPPRRLRSIKEVRLAAMNLRERGSAPPPRIEPELASEKERGAKPKNTSVDSEITLPEKYELLDKFFNSLDSSIRLLQLKRSATTFTNISSQIESLTDRRFTYAHLAQLKFIMPEAIVVEKVLRHDERTSCMKPDIRITLNVEAIESESKSRSISGNLQLRKVFRDRLLDFVKSRPESDEVPEEILPEPFNRLKEDANANPAQPSASFLTNQTPDVELLGGQKVTHSHFPVSFRKRFSQLDSSHVTGCIKQNQSVGSSSASDLEHKFARSPSGKETSAFAAKLHYKLSLKDLSKGMSSSSVPETPVKRINSMEDEEQISEMATVPSTPVDLASTPAKLMSATPMLHPPKRCCMSPDDNPSTSPSKLVRRPLPKRPLKFDSPVKGVNVDDELGCRGKSSTDDDIFDILPEALLQSIREKEKLASMEHDPAISQARWRQQMIAGLPKLFDMIYFLFQSIRRSVVTKEELIQKIMAGHLDIVDKGELEEQLRLLQELAPDWIYEKSAASGDVLVCVNKISSPEAIRMRLSEAK